MDRSWPLEKFLTGPNNPIRPSAPHARIRLVHRQYIWLEFWVDAWADSEGFVKWGRAVGSAVGTVRGGG